MKEFNVGDKVKLTTTTKPHYGWGAVKTGDIGTVIRVDNCNVIVIGFENQEEWRGLSSEVELVDEPTTILACELMVEALKSPKEYEGKRYKTTKGHLYVPGPSLTMDECVFKNGEMRSIDGYILTASSNCQLKEIKPEPKPVDVMDAMKARLLDNKTLKCVLNGIERVYKCRTVGLTDQFNTPVSATEIMNGKWFIIEE